MLLAQFVLFLLVAFFGWLFGREHTDELKAAEEHRVVPRQKGWWSGDGRPEAFTAAGRVHLARARRAAWRAEVVTVVGAAGALVGKPNPMLSIWHGPRPVPPLLLAVPYLTVALTTGVLVLEGRERGPEVHSSRTRLLRRLLLAYGVALTVFLLLGEHTRP